MRTANEISLLNTDQCLLWNSNVSYPQVQKCFPHFAHVLSTRIRNAAFLKETQNNFSYPAFDSVLKLSYCLISDFSRKDNIVIWIYPPSLSVSLGFFSSPFLIMSRTFHWGPDCQKAWGWFTLQIITQLIVVVHEMLMLRNFAAGDKMMHTHGYRFKLHLKM